MPQNHSSYAIVGNTLSAMVTALELAKQGRKVLLINPGGPWGGYFSGIISGGKLFDLGLVTLEFSTFSAQANFENLCEYNPLVRNDVGRFFDVVKAWIAPLINMTNISMPQMLVGGKMFDDVFSANSVHVLNQLPFAKSMRDEITLFSANPNLHARYKATTRIYNTLDYATASIANHGYTLHHKLIAPYLKKVLGINANAMLARYHRIPWLPLYWPETLKKVLKGEDVNLLPTTFTYPKQSSVAALTQKIAYLVRQNALITCLQSPVTAVKSSTIGWQLTLSNALPVTCEHLAWASSPATLLLALNEQPQTVIEKKAALALLFLQIPNTDICDSVSVLNVVDSQYSIYRITNQSVCAESKEPVVQMVVEFNADYFSVVYNMTVAATDDEVCKLLLQELLEIGLINSVESIIFAEIKRIPHGFLIPDLAAKNACERDISTLEKYYPSIARMGLSSGFFVTSFNDQIVQGLKYAASQTQSKQHEYAAIS